MRFCIGRIFLIICVAAVGCATEPHLESPDDALANFNQGIALSKKGDLDGAITAYRISIHLDPNHVNAHYNLGNVLAQKKD